MKTTTRASAPPPNVATGRSPSNRPMRRVAAASLIGTTIEYYDFFIFGTAAALVFGTVFFPALGPAAGTLAALATFGVAFVARPFGSILFGHFGDRVGRKATLVTTLLLMGVATLAIGLLPTAASIGVAAPILLIVLRLCQGLAVGGEWAGAVLLTAEYAPKAKRGMYALFPQLGPSLAFVLASGTFLITSLTMTDEQFMAYGWRIPFIASVILVMVGLYIRMNIEETPAFKNVTSQNDVAKVPLFEVAKGQPREVLLAAGSITMLFAFFYMGVTYLTNYGTTVLELPRQTVLSIGILAGFCFAATTVWSAIYSDRIGRRRVTVIANGLAVVWSLALFPILNIGTPLAFAVGVSVTLGIVGAAYGPAGAFLPELFRSRYRYTGAGVAYNLAGVLGGAVPPLFAAWLVASFGSYSIGVYLAAMALFSLVCTFKLRETRNSDLTS
ncbi:MFS transporter [Hoyosella altamirensis]|uniref:Putative proline/betaine transporter n=1 Tax=Hoyosella altamirensis TaxID=616997 RepID=A0A839RJJ0_9ACTN|nr:metabolite-proton symporter [Hoyosella altamirensis]